MNKNGVRRLTYLKEKGTGINVTCSDPQLYLWHCSLCSRIQRWIERSLWLGNFEYTIVLRWLYFKISNHSCSQLQGWWSDSLSSRWKSWHLRMFGLRFQPSNIRDEPRINPCRDIGGKDEINKLVEPQTGIECELKVDRCDLWCSHLWCQSAFLFNP